MKLVISTEERLVSHKGCVYTRSHNYSYTYLQSFLDTFEEIVVIGRLASPRPKDTHDQEVQGYQVTGEKISFVEFPNLASIKHIFKVFFGITTLDSKLIENTCFYLPVPGFVGLYIAEYLQKRSRTYALKLIANLEYHLSYRVGSNSIARLVLHVIDFKLKKVIKNAKFIQYVTKKSIQEFYPPPKNSKTLTLADFDTSISWIAETAKLQVTPDLTVLPTVNLLSIGTMEQMYKGFDVLIKAIKICTDKGVSLNCRIVGEGKYKTSLVNLVKKLGLSNRITFVDYIFDPKVLQAEYDSCDIFVLASKTEGLPRVLLEAMARGKPCIGSDLGGISELINEDLLFNFLSKKDLADKIIFLTSTPGIGKQEGLANLAKAKEYFSLNQEKILKDFFIKLKKATSQG